MESLIRRWKLKELKMSKKIKVQQIGSPLRRKSIQEKNLKGLGLGKLNRVVEVENTSSIQGMIKKISHLVKVL